MTAARAAQTLAESLAGASDPRAAAAQVISEAAFAIPASRAASAQVLAEPLVANFGGVVRAAGAQVLAEAIFFVSDRIKLALLSTPELQFMDANGHPYAGGQLALYVNGTTTPKDTWQDPNQTVLNTNPIVLDAAGRCIVWGDGLYRAVLHDADGNLVFDQPTSTLVSAAMIPVVGAATLAEARDAMGITTLLNAEATTRATADATETARAEAAEGTLTTNLTAEVSRATAAEAANAAAIAAETARAEAAEAGLAATHRIETGVATSGAGGHVRVTFGTPYAGDPVVFATTFSAGLLDFTFVGHADTNGADFWCGQAAAPGSPAVGVPFQWMAVG